MTLSKDMRSLAGLALIATTAACDKPTDNTSTATNVNSIACAASTSTSTTQDYTVTVQGTAQGAVGSVMTPVIGKGSGPTDPNKTIASIDQSFFTGWSFAPGPGDDILRADGDAPQSTITLQSIITETKPVTTPFAVYAHFHLVPPSGSAIDAQKTANCQ